ncbi:hypothetical protein GCM10019059_02450 [Camelimonas fluminis]|nr:hypothetical protein GCM10019059_02450 [Camelimonas fluminis]
MHGAGFLARRFGSVASRRISLQGLHIMTGPKPDDRAAARQDVDQRSGQLVDWVKA